MEQRNKSIGYLAPQYWNAKGCKECPIANEINKVLDVFKEKAKYIEQPEWYVKGACMYFTYNEDYYAIGHRNIDTSPEIFGRLACDLEDALYEIGAYDMYYAGMLD